MAKVQFSHAVKYKGVKYAPHDPFDVADEDYVELVQQGATTIEPPKVVIPKKDDLPPPQETPSGETGEGTAPSSDTPLNEEETPEDANQVTMEEVIHQEAESQSYPIETGHGWYLLSNGEKVRGKEVAYAEQEKLNA